MIKKSSKKNQTYLLNVEKIGNSENNIKTTNNVLSIEEHSRLLDFAISVDSWQIQPWGVKLFQSKDMPEEIIEILEKVFKIAYQKCTDFYNVKLRLFEKKEVHLIKFEKGYKMYQHVDTLSNDRLHVAAIYYINDDYEGGEINFTSHNLKFKPKANSLIMFPGNEGYPHEVLETIGKERYSSTLWFQFEE